VNRLAFEAEALLVRTTLDHSRGIGPPAPDEMRRLAADLRALASELFDIATDAISKGLPKN
jgi:hypothetical protein